jgi:hypothetical protein
VLSGTSVVMMRSVEVTTLHPRGPGDPKLPLVPDAAPSSLEDSPKAARIVDGPLWTIPTNMAPESRSWGESLRWPKRSMMNSRLPKWMAMPGARLTSVGLLLLVMTNESFGDGAIRTSRGKACCKSPFPACQLLVFFAPVRYSVVKNACSYSEVVLRAIKNYKVHYSLS